MKLLISLAILACICVLHARGKTPKDLSSYPHLARVAIIVIAIFSPLLCNGENFTALEKKADAWNVQAQLNVAYANATGKGVAENPRKAFKFFKKTAEEGVDFSQYQVALCYASGCGVPKNVKLAFAWFRKAAEQNVAPAQYALGLCYKRGTGVPVNDRSAFESFHDAARKGYAAAQIEMANCYTKGIWIAKDAKLAKEWAEKSRSKESLFSQKIWDDQYGLWPQGVI